MSNQDIHKTAIIDSSVKINKDVRIGPYCIIGSNVEIGEGTALHSNVIIQGNTKIGKYNSFGPFCTIGLPPQDLTYKQEETFLIIGDNNIFREYISIHRGTTKNDYYTRIGSNNFIMSYVHFGHDVLFGNNCIVANSVNIAGHVVVNDDSIINGACGIIPFITIGKGAYIESSSSIINDIPPYCLAYGNRAKLKGINIIGLKRKGFDRIKIKETINFFNLMKASSLSPRVFVGSDSSVKDFKDNEIINEIIRSIRASKEGIAPLIS